MKKKFYLLIVLFGPVFLMGQYSGSVHYTVRDGLPSSTTYCVVQDRKGFMWIGTEAGLVRYDGTNFRVFNTQSGLPDNEVLGVLVDDKTDKIWILTYSKSACYYKDGKIYTARNDSALRTINVDFGEYINGNSQRESGVFLYNGYKLFECADNRIVTFKTQAAGLRRVHQWDNGRYDFIYNYGVAAMSSGAEKRAEGDGLDSINEGGKWIGDRLFLYRPGRIDIYSRNADGGYILQKNICIHGERANEKRIFTNILQVRGKYFISVEGIGVYATDTSVTGEVQKIWTGKINDIADDRDGNIWLSTNDDGLYLIKNQPVVNYSAENGLIHDNITALLKDGDKVYLGNSNGEIFLLKDNTLSQINLNGGVSEMIRGMASYNDSLFLLVNNMIGFYDQKRGLFTEVPHSQGGPKAMLKLKDQQTLLIGFSSGLAEYPVRHDHGIEIPLNKRMIALSQHPDGRIFCGSLDGVYTFVDGRLNHLDGNDERVLSRVTSLCFGADSILWIGTPSNGVMAYDGKKIIGQISSSQYLSYIGAICRKVVSSGMRNEIWVATNSGINKIQYHIGDSLVVDNITPLNSTDGLLSDDVNDVLICNDIIYAATSRGLTVLNEKELTRPRIVPIYIMSIKINDRDSLIHSGVYDLNYNQNNLQIEYVGISLQSSGYLRYQYRLLGSSDVWQTTERTSIDLRSMSPGNYTFEVAVLDKFGNRSQETASIRFHIARAVYQTLWFFVLVLIIILGAGFWIIRGVFERRKVQYEKEQSYNMRIIDLEQQALKAQMNPHFIFNCLTAIQHFVNKEDIYSANMYLSNFAKLIRKTLDLSGEQHITLDREIAYLENYIQLEKLRFQDKFTYSITLGENVDVFAVQVPPMLLQPIIENAIRHGLRYKEGDEGILHIKFIMENTTLICMIDDNGIGIKRSGELKSTSHVEYQSKGMKLTEARISAINMISEKKIKMEVKSKYDISGNAEGTMIVICFIQ